MKAGLSTYPSRAALCLVLVVLALPAPSPAASNTLVEINKLCAPAGVDLGAWIGARTPVSGDLAGTWELTLAVGDAPAQGGFSAASDLVNGTILAEDISSGGAVVYRSVTGHDAASGKEVSLWTDVSAGTCRQLSGSYTPGADSDSASRQMADRAGSLSMAYRRVASTLRPTGPKGKGGSCVAGLANDPVTGQKQCKNGTCKSDGTCP